LTAAVVQEAGSVDSYAAVACAWYVLCTYIYIF